MVLEPGRGVGRALEAIPKEKGGEIDDDEGR